MKLDHAFSSFAVRDIDVARTFYRDTLGLPVNAVDGHDGPFGMAQVGELMLVFIPREVPVGQSPVIVFGLDGGIDAAFKPRTANHGEHYRAEIAAYRLNRLLGLNLVPPATMRGFSREEILAKLTAESAPLRSRVENETTFEGGVAYGSLSYWVPTLIHTGLDEGEGLTRWEEWLTQGNTVPPDKITLLGQRPQVDGGVTHWRLLFAHTQKIHELSRNVYPLSIRDPVNDAGAGVDW